MSSYSERDGIALCCFTEFFRKQTQEERELAEKLMEFQNRRGGRILLADIKKPEQNEWGKCSGNEAESSADGGRDVNQSLLDLQQLSTRHTDPHLCDFLESHYLDDQVKRPGDHFTNVKRLGAPKNGLGEYLFDKLSLN